MNPTCSRWHHSHNLPAQMSDTDEDPFDSDGPEHSEWTGRCAMCGTNINFHTAVLDIAENRVLCGMEGGHGDDLLLSGCAAAARDMRFAAPPLNAIVRPLDAGDANLAAISDLPKADLDARLGAECDHSDCEDAGFCMCDE